MAFLTGTGKEIPTLDLFTYFKGFSVSSNASNFAPDIR